MALSTYSKWGTLQNIDLETTTTFIQRQAEVELAGELLGYSNNFDVPVPNTLYDDPNNFIDPEDYTNLLPYLSFPPQEYFDPYGFPYPKRQKCYENNQYCLDIAPSFFDGFVQNSFPVSEFSPEYQIPLPEYQIPLQIEYCNENVKSSGVMKMNERCVSAQSIAARERRRKITEKTQELGKVIPGGSKMNTAEMLQAASKYVKFLQAQVGILQLMESFQETEEATPTEDLQVILASPTVQEKLYLEEKCLVPMEFANVLAKHQHIQSKPAISNDLNQLISSEG